MRTLKILPLAALAAIGMAMLTACGSVSSGPGHLSQELTAKDDAQSGFTSGEVHCESGAKVVGVWVQADNSDDSHFAAWKPIFNQESSADWSTTIPGGEKYSLHVGCGGTPASWGAEIRTDTVTGSGSAFNCNDLPNQEHKCASGPIDPPAQAPAPSPSQPLAPAPAPDPNTSQPVAWAYSGTDYSGTQTPINPNLDAKSPADLLKSVELPSTLSVINHTGRDVCGFSVDTSNGVINSPKQYMAQFRSGVAYSEIGLPFDQSHPLNFFAWC
jgi:hypothetical protein